MKTLITILFLSLLSSPSWSVPLVEREGIYYEAFTDVPFTGEIDAELIKGNYKNGKQEGAWVLYWENGQLMTKGNYKNGKKDGLWVYYFDDGGFNASWSGTFKNGVKISD